MMTSHRMVMLCMRTVHTCSQIIFSLWYNYCFHRPSHIDITCCCLVTSSLTLRQIMIYLLRIRISLSGTWPGWHAPPLFCRCIQWRHWDCVIESNARITEAMTRLMRWLATSSLPLLRPLCHFILCQTTHHAPPVTETKSTKQLSTYCQYGVCSDRPSSTSLAHE